MMSDVGAVAGPIIAGLIVDSTGSYEIGFLVGAGVIAVAFVLTTFMPETLRQLPPATASTADDGAGQTAAS
jgi:MFS family permease